MVGSLVNEPRPFKEIELSAQLLHPKIAIFSSAHTFAHSMPHTTDAHTFHAIN